MWTIKVAVGVLLLIASRYHLVSQISSGSVLSPEFPRPLVFGSNVLFGAILMLAVLQVTLDIVSLVVATVNQGFLPVPPSVRYTLGTVALGLSSFAVSQAIRVPPLKNTSRPFRQA